MIDRVYQKVLALANKEQRGYITPQEFNLFADQAQLEIFEQYFYDLEQFKRRPGSNTEFADLGDLVSKKIEIFGKSMYDVSDGYDFSNLDNFYRIETVYLVKDINLQVLATAERQTIEEFTESANLGKLGHTNMRPVYRLRGNIITFNPSPNPLGKYVCDYTAKPKTPNWTYVISDQSALYNPNNFDYQDFELHSSEENNLVIKILALAGVAIKDLQLVQAVGAKEAGTIQQQKQ